VKRRVAIAAFVLALAALGVAGYYWGPAAVPQGQEPLLALTPANFEEFRAEFNATADKPRIVALLSPT